MYKGQIPFDPQNGHLLEDYNSRYDSAQAVDWKDNYSFTCPLGFSHFERGRSGLWAIFDYTIDQQFAMPSNKFEEVLKSQKLENGIVTAEWTFYKQGGRYVVGLLDGRSPDEKKADEEFVALLQDVRTRKESKEIGVILGVPTAKINKWLKGEDLTRNKWSRDRYLQTLQGLV